MSHTDRRRVCVRGIIYKDGKLFCQELKGANGKGKGFWCTPGGGLEIGETLAEGLRREIVEETGVQPQIGRLLFVQQFSDKNKDALNHETLEQMEFFFHIENPEDFYVIDETASHYDAEIARSQFVDPKKETVFPKFLRTIDYESYIKGEKPVFIYDEFK